MKENNSEKNSDKKNYDLSEINKGNDIDFDLSNIENIDNKSKALSNSKKERLKFNYSKILKSIISHISDNRRDKYYEDEFEINLLQMTSLKNVYFKFLCLGLKALFNSNVQFSNWFKYILSKIKEYDKNNELNIRLLISIYKESSNIFFFEQNVFYSFYYVWKSRNLKIKLIRRYGHEENDDGSNLFTQVKDFLVNYIKKKREYFQENLEKIENIKQILDNLLRENQVNEIKEKDEIQNNDKKDIDDDNANYGSYIFLINKDWAMKAKVFVDYYIIKSKEHILEDNSSNKGFDPNKILNSYFNLESDSSQVYPGPINNFNSNKYKDCWEDPYNEDENFYIDRNSKDFIKISEKNYNILKEVFDSTNDIKILGKDLEYFQIRLLILDKRFREIVNKKLLRLRSIKARKSMKVIEFESKLTRCIYYEIKKLHIVEDDSNYFEDNINEYNDEINRLMKACDFSFYLINKENKNVLLEIALAYMNKISSYDSNFIKQLSFSEDKDNLKTLFASYDKSKHYVIIEISDKYSNIFLKEIVPDKNMLYSCGKCEKKFKEKDKYFCNKCQISMFCSRECAENCEDHKRFDKYIETMLKADISFKELKEKVLSLNAISNEGRVGIANEGKTCYMNCIIQALSNNLDLNKYFIFDFYKYDLNPKYISFEKDLVEYFSEVFKKLWQEPEQVISARKFVFSFFRQNKQFAPNVEQDAHEFLSCLLSNLHDRLNRDIPIQNNKDIEDKNNKKDNLKEKEKGKEKKHNNLEEKFKEYLEEEAKKNNSFIYELFTGYFISRTVCEECKTESINFEPFNTLSLPIPKKHFSYNLKYFTDSGPKFFPVAINENTQFSDLKEKALFYFEKDIINKIKKNCGNNLYNILNKNVKDCIYNYNITKIPKKMLYNYIDIIILDKNKSIYLYNVKDNINIFQHLKLKDYDTYEIVLYEKNIVSDDYINIYFQASYYNYDKKILFFKSSEILNYSYPLLLNVSKDMSLQNLEQVLYRKFEVILNPTREKPKKKKDNNKKSYIDIIIPHSKLVSSCPFCQKSFEESQFCYYADLLEKNSSFLSLLNNNPELNDENIPIIFIANSKYFEVNYTFSYNSNALFIQPGKDLKIDKEINLFDCLEKFREEDILDNDNKWLCEKCKVKQKARRTIELYQTPPYLIIQLKRFNYSNNIIIKLFYFFIEK